jgi:hypothetical protein
MSRTFQPQMRVPPAFDLRSSGGHGLARLRAERALRTKHEDEYRRLAVRFGHVGAVATLVRRHTKEYGRLVTASVNDAPVQPGFGPRRRLSA